jgi:cation diffusion facilitator family transporter
MDPPTGNGAADGPSESSAGASYHSNVVVNVLPGGLPKLQQNTIHAPKGRIPSLLRQPTLPPADDPFKLEGKIVSEEELAAISNKEVRAYYRRQNELIDNCLNPPSEDFDDNRESGEMSNDTKVQIAVWASTVANALLFAGQGYAAAVTGSLALFATMTDAAMDLVSSLILLATGRATRHVDRHHYPTGKNRLESLGVIVFAVLMSTVAIQLIIEGIKGIVATGPEPKETDFLAVGFIVGAMVIKAILLVFCWTLREFLSARTLAQDHMNDLLINAFGLFSSLGAVYFAGWVDPTGCLLVGLFILQSWSSTAYEQIQLLVGTVAEPELLNLLTYLALTHDERILAVDTVRAYTSGNYHLAEIDIVLPKDMSVGELFCVSFVSKRNLTQSSSEESHDIAQALQDFIEELPSIERCFVHIDHEYYHAPEHTTKSRAQFRNVIRRPPSPPDLVDCVNHEAGVPSSPPAVVPGALGSGP